MKINRLFLHTAAALAAAFLLMAGSAAGLSGSLISAYAAEEPAAPSESVTWQNCYIEGESVVVEGSLSGGITPADTAMGQDENLYLLALDPYDDDVAGYRYVQSVKKELGQVSFRVPLELGTSESKLYKKFVACIWDGGKYIRVSEPIYITNPETVAVHRDSYKEPLTKKGLLVELPEISDAFELGVSHVIVNIPYNALFGSGIDYTYEGETYHFNKEIV